MAQAIEGLVVRRSLLFALSIAGLAVTAGVHAQGQPELFVEIPSAKGVPAPSGWAERLRREPTSVEMREVRLQLPLLADGEKALTLNLPGASLTATGSVTSRNGQNFTWVGSVAGERLSSVVLVVRDGKVTGEIRANAGLFRISPLGGDRHAVVRVDETHMPADHDPDDEPPTRAIPKKALKKTGKKSDAAPAGDTAYEPPAKTFTIKAVVAYTSDAETAVPDILGKIDAAEAQANVSYERSDVRIRLKLAHVYKTAYVETGKAYTDRKMTEVRNKRPQYGADVAVLVVGKSQNKKGKDICGVARQIGASYENAFVVVKASCLGLTLAHEIGHLLGAKHNWERDKSDAPCGTFGHGLYNISGGWRTMMAYDCDPPAKGACRRRAVWSNPRLKDDNGAPLGHAKYADEARCLNTQIQSFCSGSVPCSRD